MKRFSAFLLAAALCLCFIPVAADDVTDTDIIDYPSLDGEWKIENGVLTVEGEIEEKERYPWLDYSDRITSVIVGEGVTEIPSGAFAYLDKAMSVTLPSTLTTVSEGAFAYCKSLTGLTLGANVSKIENGAFKGCKAIPAFNTADENEAYTSVDGVLYTYDKKSLVAYPPAAKAKNYDILPQTESICDYAFYSVEALEGVTLPESLISIGASAFEECKGLKELTITESVTKIGEKAFYESGIWQGYGSEVIKDGWYISENASLSQKDIAIPEEIKHIADGAFANTQIQTVLLPASLITFDGDAFADCASLSSVSVAEENTVYSSFDGVLFDRDKKTAIYCPRKHAEKYTLPETAELIKSGAFAGGAKSITVPNDSCVFESGSITDCTYIYGNEDSNAQKYANEAGITFRIIGVYYNDFIDVDENKWYAPYVEFAVVNGLMSGISPKQFAPELTTTRAMLVRVLYNLEKSPDASEYEIPFDDIEAGSWYDNAVRWAYKNKIISGMSPTKFAPSGTLTREQFATIMFNYATFKGYDITGRADLSTFNDSGDISDYAKDTLSWANHEGMITGMNPTTLNPKGNATRAQMATILRRFITSHKE